MNGVDAFGQDIEHGLPLSGRPPSSVAPSTRSLRLGGVYKLEDSPQAFVDFAERHTRGKLVVTT
jgi:hypothetical protein